MKISELKNIGPTVEQKLNELGIFTLSDLKKTGSAQVYRMMKKQNPGKTIPVCYYLYSLEGAIQDCHWNDFSEKEKRKMKQSAGAE